MKAFHAYDIRGIYNTHFNREDVYKIGFFLPKLLKTNKILVGRDARVSSPQISEYLIKGITDSGSDVYYVGLATTPLVYFLTAKYNFEGSVMITASHNGKEYNGLKVSTTGAAPVGYDTGLKELERLIQDEKIEIQPQQGKIIDFDKSSEYLKFLNKYLKDLSHLKLSIDCSNGMAGLFIRKLIGNWPVYLNEALNGHFPGHAPNPLAPENIKDLQKSVIENKSDLGIIFDGDGDRVMFVDENGSFIPPDLMIGVMAPYFIKKYKGHKPLIIHDIRTSKSAIEYIKQAGGEPYIWKVGRAFAAIKLKEIDGLFGGELAGHYYFRDFYFSDSGLLACLVVLGIVKDLKSKGKTISALIKEIVKYANSGEINFNIEKKAEAIEKVKSYFTSLEKPSAVYDFDGYRVEFSDWWFNIRPSNTEPYLRLLVEAKTNQLLEEKIMIIKNLLKKFILK